MGVDIYVRKVFLRNMKWKKKNDHGYLLSDFIKYVCRRPDPNFDYNKYVNKYLAKGVVHDVIKVAEVYGHITNIQELNKIDFAKFPNKFMMKATDGAGMNKLINKNESFQLKEIKKLCTKWLSNKYAYNTNLHSRRIQHGIIFEEYLGSDISNYKFWVINGKVESICRIDYSKGNKGSCFYDPNWKLMPKDHQEAGIRFEYGYKNMKPPDPLFQEISLKTISKLSKIVGNIPFVRIDLYEKNNVPIFGEFTFTPLGGKSYRDSHIYATSLDFDTYLGSLLDFDGISSETMEQIKEEWKNSW
jgi:hypothetical protein